MVYSGMKKNLRKCGLNLSQKDQFLNIYSNPLKGHSHEADSVHVEVDVIVDRALKIAVANPTARNRSIFSAATEGVSEEVLYALDRTKLYKRLGELRMKAFPQGPTDPVSLVIPEAWMKHVDGSPFVIYDSGSESNRPRIVLISSDYMLQKLSESTFFAADGTFFARPRAVFMADKSEESYCRVLQAIGMYIHQKFQSRWRVTEVMTDFEVAIGNAIRRYFGEEAAHRCCFFHFSYSLGKKLKSLGLLKKCNREATFQAYIREFRIIPLLPIRDVSSAFENISDLTLPHRSQF
uniref:MULE transposase domain-containing protein n=1 Tax=Ditylenchus dipsaci TaxID=166011 RepID=A0A915EDP3_9BILA